MDKVNIVMTYTDSITYENNVELILHVGHEGYDILPTLLISLNCQVYILHFAHL